jgi:hypothetical protein
VARLTLFSDIKFVTTESGARPSLSSPKNWTPIQPGDGQGRGSLVFFNEASMYQSSETGFATLEDAREAGLSGNTDYGSDAQAAFQRYGIYSPID